MHCAEAGAGLICCYSRKKFEIVTEPAVEEGDFWREYEVLCDLMDEQGWEP